MSLHDKISSLMARPGQDLVAKDDVPWWLKTAGRGVGTVGGFIAALLGLWESTGILLANVYDLIAGVWLILASVLMLCVEAPCCCMFLDHVQRLSDFIDNRPYWNRALAYFIMSLPAVIISFGATTFFASGMFFATGVLYGMMALGRKASAEEMRRAAAASDNRQPKEQTPSSNMRDNLVSNAQPISFTGAPVFDSNV
ncbi:hypothetical protein GWI33_014164 [Rhynchophorus ferrugineus]|uniref:Calcium channel flower n=1 Tax=Rhynchophorus ferrugineus TaxID=354439 RepID=A0A834MCM5_RHYFE|nr:hypothetical protein GWI33_014164 [Rhynchophorus ferrugineus]